MGGKSSKERIDEIKGNHAYCVYVQSSEGLRTGAVKVLSGYNFQNQVNYQIGAEKMYFFLDSCRRKVEGKYEEDSMNINYTGLGKTFRLSGKAIINCDMQICVMFNVETNTIANQDADQVRNLTVINTYLRTNRTQKEGENNN